MDVNKKIKQKKDALINKVKHNLSHKTLNKVILLSIFMSLFVFGLRTAHAKTVIVLPEFAFQTISLLTLIILSYTLATIIIKLTLNLIVNIIGGEAHIEQKILLSKFYFIMIYTFATIYIFWKLGISVQNITIFIGFMATGFAFAIRDIITSYLVWFMLLVKKPFKIGDYIKIGDEEGIVLHIGTFYVIIDDSPETYSDYYRIPNKTFIEKPIRNLGRGHIAQSTYLTIKKMPSDFVKRLKNIETKLEETFDTKLTVDLIPQKDFLTVEVRYFTSPQERFDKRDQILKIMIEELDGFM